MSHTTPTDAAGGRVRAAEDWSGIIAAADRAARITFETVKAAGGHVEPGDAGYILHYDGDIMQYPTLEALAVAFAEHEAARLSDAYDRVDGALDLVAELRERNKWLERALNAARAELEFCQENYIAQADQAGCDAGNWDGGSAWTCEHCQWTEGARKIGKVIDAIRAALEASHV